MPAVFLVTLVLAASVAVIAKGVLSDKLSEDERKKVEVGICGDLSDSYLGIGVLAVQQLDSSRFAINFHTLEEAEAREMLLDGKLTAYLVIPDGFVDSVVSGENFSVRYYTANSQMGMGTMLMNELTNIISELVTKSQSAIYGMQNLCNAYGRHDIYWDVTNELNLEYIDIILSRQLLFEVETLGVSNDLSLQGYYICGFAILFFMIFGINGCPIFVRKDMSLARLMSAGGVGSLYQVLVEFVTYLIMVMVCMLSVFLVLAGVCQFAEFSVPEWRNVDFATVFGFGVSLVPVMIMLTAMAQLGHELSGNIVSGMLIQFLVTLSMGYVCGCFYPASFFPEGIQVAGRLLPPGVAMKYASGCMIEEVSALAVLGVLFYTVLFVVLTWRLRQRKLEHR